MRLPCLKCSGESLGCEECHGSGNAKCEARGCDEDAICFNEDGKCLCEDCFTEWCCEAHARS